MRLPVQTASGLKLLMHKRLGGPDYDRLECGTVSEI